MWDPSKRRERNPKLTVLVPKKKKKRIMEEYFSSQVPKFSLDAAGLVALADITTAQERTALTGTSSLLDLLVLVPGIHLQQNATELNRGEYPACAALTTGYVFRIENPATVY